MLEFQDQLKKSRKRNSSEREIIETVSSFNPVGRQRTFLQQNGTKDAITGFVVTFAILLFIAFYKALLNFEKANRERKN